MVRSFFDRDARKARLAELVAGGMRVHEAGQACMGLTKGQTARLWADIRADLGAQAK